MLGNLNLENISHREGQFGFILRQEYYGFVKQLSEIFLKQNAGNRYFNIQFFLQRKTDGYKFLVENWSFELKDLQKCQATYKKNAIQSFLINIKDKIKKEELNLNLSILVRQIAVILTQSTLWKNYLQIDKDDMLFQTFRLKHFLDYKLTYFQQKEDDQWLSQENVKSTNLKMVQIGHHFLLETKVSFFDDMDMLRKVPLLNKHQVHSNNQCKKSKRERFLSDNIFSDNYDEEHSNNKQSQHLQHKGKLQFGKHRFEKRLSGNNKFLSCGKLNELEEEALKDSQEKEEQKKQQNEKTTSKTPKNLQSPDSETNNKQKQKLNKREQFRKRVAENKSLLCSDFLQRNQIDEKDIEIVQTNNQYGQDSIISMYSKKDDITIISTPEELKIKSPEDEPLNTDDEENNLENQNLDEYQDEYGDEDEEYYNNLGQNNEENIEFELCGNLDSNQQTPKKQSSKSSFGKQQQQSKNKSSQKQRAKNLGQQQQLKQRQLQQQQQFQQQKNRKFSQYYDDEQEITADTNALSESQQKEEFRIFMDGVLQGMEIYLDEVQDEPITKAQSDLQLALQIFQ
ncbi:hypothetical protein PPERSA_09904 [Pseudocohnilembus persalinus]|uniref:Uncharacterized protein n=1 Tax=Pseudocohnilembus persalinus TaxID=266149 RepID=A0A0V0QU29_PSEPJ|nr:hypothetical protein PPERSA_09904 [Pseudocohnilembus persalinus]|eukprot:KRX05764.1 hypothetical protein PPERSA_09904 [Pseudocohnilembus persalinus]